MRLFSLFVGVIFLYLVLLLSSLNLAAFSSDKEDENPLVKLREASRWHSMSFSKKTRINVLDFGAVGDGITDDTKAIQRALFVPQAKTVWLPRNYIFKSGPLNLTSYTTLQVDGTLKALLPNETSWPFLPPLEHYGNSRDGKSEKTVNGRETRYLYWQHQALLYADSSKNITITGRGVIDGSGPYWWDLFAQTKGLSALQQVLPAGRPNLIQLLRCDGVEISHVTLRDSPFWCLHPVLSRYLHIHHVTIRSKLHAPNSDGIDPDSCQHVLIENNDISVGDDHIAVKAGVCGFSSPLDCTGFADGKYETVNVTIRNNTFRTGMGVAIGSEGSGGIRNILVENNHIGVCISGYCSENCCGWGFGIHIKTVETRGAYFSDMVFRNNTIYNSTVKAILLETGYQKHYNGSLILNPTRMENILFENNKRGGTAKGKRISCSTQLPCENLTFIDNDF